MKTKSMISVKFIKDEFDEENQSVRYVKTKNKKYIRNFCDKKAATSAL